MAQPEPPASARGHTRGSRALPWLASAAFACLFAGLGLSRFSAVHNQTFDLAQYTRLAWGLAHAEPWDAIVGGHFLGGHLAWVLAPLGALGSLFGTARVLICAQAVALAFAAVPIARLAARRLGPPAGLWLALLYLAHPNLGAVASYEMHPGSLAVLPLACALDALDARNTRAFVLSCLCVLACRASLALELSLLGGLTAVRGVHPVALRRAGACIALLALGYLALSLLVLQPRFVVGSAVGGMPSSMQQHFGHFGGSAFGVVPALLEDPARVLRHLATQERLSYLPRVLLPFVLLPLLAPWTAVVAAPTLAINLLSQFPTTTLLSSHYLTPAVPVLAAASVHALRWEPSNARLQACMRWLVRMLPASALLAVGSAAFLLFGALAPSSVFRPDERTLASRAVLAQIPSSASVQAPYPLLAHLAERRLVHRGPPPDRGADFVVLDLEHRARFAQREDLLRTQEEPLARWFLSRADYGLVTAASNLALLKRGQDPRAGFVRRYFASQAERARLLARPAHVLTGCLSVRGAWLSEAATPQLVVALSPRAACPEDLALHIRTRARPSRVDLACDGLLSPTHFRAGDLLLSSHVVTAQERSALRDTGLVLSALRSSGAPPEPHDPHAVAIDLHR